MRLVQPMWIEMCGSLVAPDGLWWGLGVLTFAVVALVTSRRPRP